MSRTLTVEPLYCSQGGIPYNKAHLDAKDAEIERLKAALQALHDWYVEYARINNLFNADGSPATFHELLEARRALEAKP